MEPIFEIKEEKGDSKYAKLVISPLVAGFGHTMGTALRRVMLSSLNGAAITRVQISGVKHQFSSLKGMKEDVLDFLLNLKKVRFVYEGDKPAKVTLSVKTAGEVKAGDIKTPSGVKVANPELVLSNLSKGAKLEAKMEVESGVGYSPSEDREKGTVGMIPLDASFSPVQRVNFKVEETRVGRFTNYDKLVMEVWTDGTLSPREALSKSSKILSSYLEQVINPVKPKKKEVQLENDGLGVVGSLSVEEIGLPTRVANALVKSGLDTVDKLATAKREDLSKVRNLGEKSIDIVYKVLKDRGVELTNA
ncbi:MAG: DNA-directed RNA polymerase subunit alpha [Candidatus Woesebacteria bacterium GW2011_GWB1_43_14]|uniref:DNA-directed RNA polymerase subunit alpha n=1 Tax=Candidatus Woesebacteria bacterium GW2011_GWB1_43_14 TaxID=1618578 RepID=A0A0G1DIF8_9BACT|nr:MAG: DNA-directed RNA polymerase subunit alpha [Candidatus Woesebacteria bacterium GW2011_GWA1_39_11b]KKS78043.1 MAG: DNA-directed RNA polymerase subunit alpha [Candidatus Woesebacteria bacterium GW2011_GWC1_42_9]KKS97377.1 MAG: DNA-directed RNA polymerase subunit alpha [Candidatus Woesebacteria bacterium GW2011_GWB1_43_14]